MLVDGGESGVHMGRNLQKRYRHRTVGDETSCGERREGLSGWPQAFPCQGMCEQTRGLHRDEGGDVGLGKISVLPRKSRGMDFEVHRNAIDSGCVLKICIIQVL